MTAQVTFRIKLPDEAEQCTPDQITEWLRFNLNENGFLAPSPVSDCEMTPVPFSVEWEYV
jgi:hypothetical protein